MRAPDWKTLFLYKIKIKQNPDCRRNEYNAIFEHLHQNVRVYPKFKKICIYQLLGKCYCIFGRRILAKGGVDDQVWFVPDTLVRYVGHCNISKTTTSVYTDTKLLYKYEHFFSLKNDNLINLILCKHTLERLSSQSEKVWDQGDLKNPNFPTGYWIGKSMEVQPRLIVKKKKFFHLLLELWKNQLGKTWNFSPRPISKNRNLETMDKLGKVAT